MIKKSSLQNGLRVLTEFVPHVRSVALGIWVGAGSRWEPDHMAGVSHLVEHLMFKGNHGRSTQELAEEIDRVGGNLNAYTSKEYTCYSAKVLVPNLDKTLGLMSEMLLLPRFDPAELEREKSVVLEEIKMYEDSPDDVVHDLVSSCLWRKQPLGRAILGSRESVVSMNRDDIREFHRQFYVPQNAVLVAVGNVQHQQFLQKADQYFGHWAGCESGHDHDHADPRMTASRCVRIKDVEQVHLCLGFEGRKLGNTEVYTLLVLSTLLGGGSGSRLFQRIREEHGLAYSIYTFQCSYRDTGLFGMYSATSPDYADQVLALTMAELERLQTDTVGHDELDRAKSLLKTELVLGLESSSSRMGRIGSSELMLGRPLDPDEAIHHLDGVTKESIQHLSQQLFHRERMAVAAVAPTPKPFADIELELMS